MQNWARRRMVTSTSKMESSGAPRRAGTNGRELMQNVVPLAAGRSRSLSQDPELPTLEAQLVIFARELGELYSLERVRSRELEHALQGVQEMYVATMKSLAQVVEAKDKGTRGHLDRTQLYGLALARRVDPALAARPEVGYGFFLHDIGKVGVPEHVLSKPG